MMKHFRLGLKASTWKLTSVAIAVMAVISSCSGSGGEKLIPIGGAVSFVGAFAYVEEIRFPTEIRAGEDVTVELLVSALANQDSLRTPHQQSISTGVGYSKDQGGNLTGIFMDSCLEGSSTAAEPRTVYQIITLPLQEPGDYKLYVLSADSPGNGGLTTRVHITPFAYTEPHPNLIVREFPFTVLPAEDELAAGAGE